MNLTKTKVLGEREQISWLVGTGRYPEGKLGHAVAQMKLQPAGGFHPYVLRLLNYRLSQ